MHISVTSKLIMNGISSTMMTKNGHSPDDVGRSESSRALVNVHVIRKDNANYSFHFPMMHAKNKVVEIN